MSLVDADADRSIVALTEFCKALKALADGLLLCVITAAVDQGLLFRRDKAEQIVGKTLHTVSLAGTPIMQPHHLVADIPITSLLKPWPQARTSMSIAMAMEVGCEGLQFDWSGFEPTTSTVGDHWGHVYNFPE